MSDRPNNDEGGSLPFPRTEVKFRGFPEFRSNVLYCPKQFFSIVIPHSSVNCIRLVAHMLRQTLGWVDEDGEPLKEQHEFSYRDLEEAAGVSHSRLPEAIEDALKARFIRCTKKATMQSQGVRAQSAAYELCWDDTNYTDDPEEFQGFYLHQSYVDGDGQNRIGRKNIPNIFFDYLIRNENRGLIRVVGTLLWYSIDWSKAGERRRPVKKSLRDLVELTQLFKGSVVRALNEAEAKGYVERIERGVFDLSGRKESSTTVYGIKWTSEYTYTHEGLPLIVNEKAERSQNETQLVSLNAPKKRHGAKGGTLPKRDTETSPERSQKESLDAPKTRHGERSQNETKRIINTTISNTPINNSSSDSPALAPAVVALELVELLAAEGFSQRDAAALAAKASEEVILRQIELLPFRNASKNKLGMLRRSIEENWPAPEGHGKTKDVFSSSPGRVFAAHFYAGYHGNPEAPVTDPSEADAAAAESFVKRILTIEPDKDLVPTWGRQFGELVAFRHKEKRHNFPALQPALRQFGDEFFTRLKAFVESDRRKRLEDARALHFSRFKDAHADYVRQAFHKHEAEQTPLFEEFLSEDEESVKSIRTNRFGLDTENLLRMYQSDAARMERFDRFLPLSQTAHDVLDFWSWDRKLNAEPFNEEKL